MNLKEVIKTLELAKAEVEWNYPMDYAVAIDEAIKAIDKQIPENGFKNECGCIVDYELLYRAIDKKCRSKNCYCHNKYRIFLHNSYPSVCINREKYYVHILVGEMIYGNIRKGYVIHHKDKNKLNALPQNLELMSIYKHNKLHAEERKGLDFRSENGKKNSINALRDARIRKDVTKGKIEELRRQGLTIQEISEVLNCGINTVYRRLEIKA